MTLAFAVCQGKRERRPSLYNHVPQKSGESCSRKCERACPLPAIADRTSKILSRGKRERRPSSQKSGESCSRKCERAFPLPAIADRTSKILSRLKTSALVFNPYLHLMAYSAALSTNPAECPGMVFWFATWRHHANLMVCYGHHLCGPEICDNFHTFFCEIICALRPATLKLRDNWSTRGKQKSNVRLYCTCFHGKGIKLLSKVIGSRKRGCAWGGSRW